MFGTFLKHKQLGARRKKRRLNVRPGKGGKMGERNLSSWDEACGNNLPKFMIEIA